MLYYCCDDRRRNELALRNDLNGIDFLEVLDTSDQAQAERQRMLFVHFIHDPSSLGIQRENVEIAGGERIRDLRVLAAQVQIDPRSGSTSPVLVVEVDTPGDFSTYTLRLVPTAGSSMQGLDPVLRAIDFGFKVNCETQWDPLRVRQCPPKARSEPALDYLARDFPSLRQLLLDRLAVVAPDWQERNPADLGMTLVELMAYIGDQLSYRQDAVATEGYLGTCRLRTSARRHARLVDYFMHDGCNARVWVQVSLDEGTPPFELRDATFYSAVSGLPARIIPGSRQHDQARNTGAAAFQLMAPTRLTPQHNLIRFYTWGARQCCLPKGAVRATVRGDLRQLQPGMVLVFKEARSPRSGDPDDADLAKRHAVLLTEVWFDSDPVGGRFDQPPTNTPLAVTEIRWADDDALPFPFCLSAETSAEFGSAYVEDVTIALGNIVLADHGAPVEEDLGFPPEDTIRQSMPGPAEDGTDDACREDHIVMAPARFRPLLRYGPLTQAAPLDLTRGLASALEIQRYHPRDAVPRITLDDGTSQPWEPRLDLLSSRSEDKHFVVEVEADGRGRVRCGDGRHGARPAADRRFAATYRVGNGRAGNVGADTLIHIVCSEGGIAGVANPLPAGGGLELETIDEVRQFAPWAFRPQNLPGRINRPDGKTLGRAVTPADYAAVVEQHPEVQRAAATFRWTGSWRTVSVTVDRLGDEPVTQPFEHALDLYLQRYRLAGHDLEIEPPRSVALGIAMQVHVKPGYYASAVRRALLDVFSNRLFADGRRGVFHPDNLTFGQTIYLSPLYAAAQAVEGVESVQVITFQRRDRPGSTALDEGRLVLGRLEIARLDNDPNFPERGIFTLVMEGGR